MRRYYKEIIRKIRVKISSNLTDQTGLIISPFFIISNLIFRDTPASNPKLYSVFILFLCVKQPRSLLCPHRAPFQHPACLLKLCHKYRLIRQSHAVFRGQNFVWQPLKSISGNSRIFLCAENLPDRRVLILMCPVLTGIIEIKVHLSSITPILENAQP